MLHKRGAWRFTLVAGLLLLGFWQILQHTAGWSPHLRDGLSGFCVGCGAVLVVASLLLARREFLRHSN